MNKIIQDIITLKKSRNLVEDDATNEKQHLWYDFALKNGLVIVLYQGNELLGFLEFVRLSEPPKVYDDIYKDKSNYVDGNTCFVSNCIADNSNTLWQLKRKLLDMNKDISYYVWHRKKNDRLLSFKNIRRIKCTNF